MRANERGEGRILVVEDDASLRRMLVDELGDGGYQVRHAESAEEAQVVIEEWEPDLVVSDLRLPGADGAALLAYTRSLHQPPGFILVTAFGTVSQAVECLRAGADDFLTKPLDLDHLAVSVSRVFGARRLRRELEEFRQLAREDAFRGIIGRSRAIRVLIDQLRLVARASGHVLIVGESGVGKELVARAVHAESGRAGSPFVAVNCAGIPAELLESEFFGHVAGAFTGAGKGRRGLFEESDGGTLFLDEIGEMPAPLQAKLLRVLQDGMIRPVGGTRERRVDVRVVAATNRDLREEIRAGRFREDLYYRLETFILKVPPLRERGDDVELLAHRFLRQFNVANGRDIRGFSADSIEALTDYSFPGNVRELKNAVERAVAFCDGTMIRPEHLPRRIREGGGEKAGDAPTITGLRSPSEIIPLAELERRYIRHVLDRVGGNKRQAAKLLKIGRRTLYRRIEEDVQSG